jgi:Chaperone of endosialidase
MSNKSTLRGFFVTAARPNQAQFEDLVDSNVNLFDTNNGNVQLTGGVVVGGTSVPDVQGAIKWDGTNFLFRTAAGFQTLSFAGASNPQDIGNVRIGSTLTGGIAAIAHSTRYTIDDFAFAQTSGGTTLINAGGSNPILIQNRNLGVITNLISIQSTRTTVSTQFVAGTLPAIPPALPAAFGLAIYGDAVKNTGASWSVMSDVRVKKDVSPFTEGLAKLLKIKPVWFRYKGMEEEKQKQEQVGVLAHEIRDTFPYMVSESGESTTTEDGELKGLLTFNPSALSFVIVNAIRELHERLDRLEQNFKK